MSVVTPGAMTPLQFPRGFSWGVAGAAPQIEGAAQVDGKGESIWDRFSRQPGRVHAGDTPEIACDHYHRFRRDFALMRRLGVKHYRLSIAWPRLYPSGDGAVNSRGVDFYQRVFDALEENGITPWVTMFHWDLPQALEDRGGWRTRPVVECFARYADTVVRAYGRRVKHWISVNEIPCFTDRAYGAGNKAPGADEPPAVVNQAFHHALLCHGHAVRAVREHGAKGSRIGLAENPEPVIPLTETPRDVAAARAAFAAGTWRVLDPIYRGAYNPAYLRAAGKNRPKVARGDFELIGLPTDFLGLNIYSGTVVRAGARGRAERLPFPPAYPRADSPWLYLLPQAIYWGPRFAQELFGVSSIVITENGCGYDESAQAPAAVSDLHRREFLRSYLRELHRAIRDGVPVEGYLLWSFLDNFEWQDGYARRFGICHVDFATQRRTPKLSAHWYAAVMRANRVL